MLIIMKSSHWNQSILMVIAILKADYITNWNTINFIVFNMINIGIWIVIIIELFSSDLVSTLTRARNLYNPLDFQGSNYQNFFSLTHGKHDNDPISWLFLSHLWDYSSITMIILLALPLW